MPQNYTPEFKKKIVGLRLEEGRTISSITTEYHIFKEKLRRWCNEFKEECQTSPSMKTEYDNMKEILKLKRESEEFRKENLFLKISICHHRWHCIHSQKKSMRGLSVYWTI